MLKPSGTCAGIRTIIIVPLKSISGGRARIARLFGTCNISAFPESTANSPCKPSTTIFMFDEMP